MKSAYLLLFLAFLAATDCLAQSSGTWIWTQNPASLGVGTAYIAVSGVNVGPTTNFANTQAPMPVVGEISGLTVNITAVEPAGASLQATVMLCTPVGTPSGCTPTATPIACTVASGANTCTVSSPSMIFAAGDLLNIRLVQAGAAGPNAVIRVATSHLFGTGGGGGPGFTMPSGALPGQTLGVSGTLGSLTLAAGSPGLMDSSSSPVSMPNFTPNCGGTTNTGDRTHIFVLQANASINVPASGGVGCANAVFYFLAQASTNFTPASSETIDIYNGTAHTTACASGCTGTTATLAAGEYATLANGSANTWHMMIGHAGSGGGGGSSGFGVASDAVQYVSPNGSNGDGLSWATAKTDIQSAYTALPPTGGTINLAGVPCPGYSFSSLIFNTNNKPVRLVGSGTYSTCLTYTGTTGSAITLDTGRMSSFSDFFLQTLMTGTANGLLIGGTNGCNKCNFTRLSIQGFQTTVMNQAYGTDWYTSQLGYCLPSTNSVAFEQMGGGDDTHIFGSEIASCGTLFYLHNNSVLWADKTVLRGGTNVIGSPYTTVFVNADATGKFGCDMCHFFNPQAGTVTKWFGATNASTVNIRGSAFDSQRDGTVAPQFATIVGGTLIFTGNQINHFGTETAPHFITLYGTVGGSGFASNQDNYVYSPTAVPMLYATGSLNTASYTTVYTNSQQTYPASTNPVQPATGLGGNPFTAAGSGGVAISYSVNVNAQSGVGAASATNHFYIYRFLASTVIPNSTRMDMPIAGDTGVQIIDRSGVFANDGVQQNWTGSAVDTVYNASTNPTGYMPGTAYRYVIGLSIAGAQTFALQAGGTITFTEQ